MGKERVRETLQNLERAEQSLRQAPDTHAGETLQLEIQAEKIVPTPRPLRPSELRERGGAIPR